MRGEKPRQEKGKGGREGKRRRAKGLLISALLLPFVTRAWVEEWRRGRWRGSSLVAVGGGGRGLRNRRHPPPRNRCLEDPRRLGAGHLPFPSDPATSGPWRRDQPSPALAVQRPCAMPAARAGAGLTRRTAPQRPESRSVVLGGKISSAAAAGESAARVVCRVALWA